MSITEAIVYGIIQGLTEFLPVSSSGHLSAIQSIFATEDIEATYFTFNLLCHLGTLLAVFISYYKDVFNIILSFFTLCGKIFKGKLKLSECTSSERFVVLLFFAVIPLAIGAILEDSVSFVSGYLWIIGAFWLVNGVILLASERFFGNTKTENDATVKNAFAVGLFQLIALFPGISRSGITITAGMFNGFDRNFAVKFSFILSIPAILGANVFSFIKNYDLLSAVDLPVYSLGFVAALVSGLCAIKLLNFITKKNTFKPFAYYCFAIGAFALVYGLIR